MKSLATFFRTKRMMGRKWLLTNYSISIIYCLILLTPIFFVFLSSFKSNQEIFTKPLSLPTKWDLTRYFEVQRRVNILKAMLVSLGITVGSEALTLILGFLAAYALARTSGRVARFVEAYFSAGFLIPAFAILVPVFLLAARTHLLYRPIFIILYYSAARLSFTVVLLTSTICAIPIELEESAICDGGNLLQILVHVVFPLSRSGVVTVLIINFIEIWNEYLFALILLNQENSTVQRVLPMLRAERASDYGLIAAGFMIAIIPVVAVFVFFQERIVSGVYSGGVKG